MGGKKKTKWRKIPLEELENVTTKNETRTSEQKHHFGSQEEETQERPSYEQETRNENFYDETVTNFGDYANGFWVPRSDLYMYPSEHQSTNPVFQCLDAVYPAVYPQCSAPEVLLFPNYFVPSNIYYYCYLTKTSSDKGDDFSAMPSFGQPDAQSSSQVPVYAQKPPEQVNVDQNTAQAEFPSFQNYVVQSPTCHNPVYLLLPQPTLPPVPRIGPQWLKRRRRRRDEDFADYAIIPEKQSACTANGKPKASELKLTRSENSRSKQQVNEEKGNASTVKTTGGETSASSNSVINNSVTTDNQTLLNTSSNSVQQKSEQTSSDVKLTGDNNYTFNEKESSNLFTGKVFTQNSKEMRNGDLTSDAGKVKTVEKNCPGSNMLEREECQRPSGSEDCEISAQDGRFITESNESAAERTENEAEWDLNDSNTLQCLKSATIQTVRKTAEPCFKNIQELPHNLDEIYRIDLNKQDVDSNMGPSKENDLSAEISNLNEPYSETTEKQRAIQTVNEARRALPPNFDNTKSNSIKEDLYPSVHSLPAGKINNSEKNTSVTSHSSRLPNVEPNFHSPFNTPSPPGLHSKSLEFDTQSPSAANFGNIHWGISQSMPKKHMLYKQTRENKNSASSPFLINSDAPIRETETELYELGGLKSLSSLQPNRSIYKLAYDENLTDQSDAEEDNSRASSPESDKEPSPESQVPSSIPRSEILIHEADSASDAGSEDVELIPHRYESETFLNDSKHVYVNKLSLAVELLRTRENLPYDEEFKRVVGEKNKPTANEMIHQQRKSDGEVNPSFIDDTYTPTEEVRCFKLVSKSESLSNAIIPSGLRKNEDGEHEHRHSRISTADSGVQSEESGDETCEQAKEVCELSSGDEHKGMWTDTDEVNAGYLRFGVQAQQRFNFFPPRMGVINPCFCCILM